MNKQLLEKKLKYASPEELLFLLLVNTENKFKKTIELWKNNDAEGTILAGKLMDNIIELKSSLNVNISTDENIRQALLNVSNLYGFIIDEISASSFKKDYVRLENAFRLFLDIKEIFEKDRENVN